MTLSLPDHYPYPGVVLDVTQRPVQEGKKGVAFVKFARYSDAVAAVENVKTYRKQVMQPSALFDRLFFF